MFPASDSLPFLLSRLLQFPRPFDSSDYARKIAVKNKVTDFSII